jgi:dTDP-glucose 4,6-dehydratase
MSTDETYGSITQGLFTEDSPYQPNSPYAASKAAGDHLVRAYRVTYELPTLIARASNTYGPRQYPEKLIPHMTICALSGKLLPIYGQGRNARDWMYVGDLVRGLVCVVAEGVPGETYNFAGGEQWANIDTVRSLCRHLDSRVPTARSYETTMDFVEDRPGHDYRYAMSSEKVGRVFGWTPVQRFSDGLPLTIDWYLANRPWWQAILNRGYHSARIGLRSS